MSSFKNPKTRIGIIGAGPAGISAAHFLKKQGYSNVTILEQHPQVGGKCISKTIDGKSFDIGANYVTSNYKIVKKLARELKADLYTEANNKSYDLRINQFRSVLSTVLGDTSLIKFAWLCLCYMYKRWKLNDIISPKNPGYKGIANHPELCQSFESWLKENNLTELLLLFEVPISLMGYSKLANIPTAYALTYLPNSTFIELCLASISTSILGYPKRFKEGYQRFLERLSWTFDSDSIKLNTKVTSVKRGDNIQVEYIDNSSDENQIVKQTIEFDYLFIGVPLYLEALQPFMSDMTPAEKEIFSQVIFDPFIVTTYKMANCEVFTAGTFMLPEPAKNEPFVITRQFAGVDFISIYTRSAVGEPVNKEKILEENAKFIKRSVNLDLCEPYSFNDFVYFPHVLTTPMANGFYDNLEALQGQNNTFYIGGLMNFELVETIMNYSKHLIETNFPKVGN
ncbi:FAD-dependent oxidoreductase [Emticicia sp. SJ17W-69]|uniref:FAD-dependent oxidoreductase n=1 Tax=Emticicia sp. SJ17W-69 TaxID=3421657 RepID=UPI003EBF393E